MDASTASLLASKRRELLSLDTQKKALESEAEAIVSELTAESPEGVSWITCLCLCLPIEIISDYSYLYQSPRSNC
jgi:hypothetical protein